MWSLIEVGAQSHFFTLCLPVRKLRKVPVKDRIGEEWVIQASGLVRISKKNCLLKYRFNKPHEKNGVGPKLEWKHDFDHYLIRGSHRVLRNACLDPGNRLLCFLDRFLEFFLYLQSTSYFSYLQWTTRYHVYIEFNTLSATWPTGGSCGAVYGNRTQLIITVNNMVHRWDMWRLTC